MTDGGQESKRLIRFCSEQLELPCEWENCHLVDTQMHSFLYHICVHLQNLTEGDKVCSWRECGSSLRSTEELCRHVLFHAFHTKIKCFGKNLQLRKELQSCSLESQSRNIIPELPDTLMCCWEGCDDGFNCPESFYRHADCHAENIENPKTKLQCKWHGCDKNCSSNYRLKDHLRSHTQEKLIACPTCGGMFCSRTKFFDHVQRQLPLIETEVESFQCGYCSRKFISERLLRDHMRHHVNHYKCPCCDMTCPNPSSLQNHITYRHSKKKPFCCEYCDYKCKSATDLRKHLDTHNSVAPYQCPITNCNYASRSSSCFKNHLSKKHSNEHSLYACHLCTKRFTRGNYLTKHLIAKHKFRWPSGHSRFRYHRDDDDGFYRLQTVRYESIELSEPLLQDERENDSDNPNDNIIDNAVENTSTGETENQQKATLPLGNHMSTTTEGTSDTTESRMIQIPLVLCVADENKTQNSENNPEECDNEFAETSVLLEIPGSTGVTLLTDNGSSVLLLDALPKQDDQPLRIIEIMQKDKDGKTIVQKAQIIADGGEV